MKITYKNGELYYGDCREKLDELETHSIDLLLTDLPYGVTSNKKDIRLPMLDYVFYNGKQYEGYDNFIMQHITKNDFNSLRDYWNENVFEGLWTKLNRVVKPNGAMLLFGQGEFFSYLIQSNKKNYKTDYIWDKVLMSNHLNSSKQRLSKHEMIGVFYRKTPVYNPQMKEGKPLHSQGKKKGTKTEEELVNRNYGKYNITVDYDKRKGSTEKFPHSILTYQKPHPSKARHRTEKPVELLKELILTFSNPGDIVLDICAGSGSTGEAALACGRKYVLIENDIYEFKNIKENFDIYEQ